MGRWKKREREREERGKQSKGSEVKKREKTFFIYPAQKLALKYRFGLEYRGADCLIYSISPTPYLSLSLSPSLNAQLQTVFLRDDYFRIA